MGSGLGASIVTGAPGRGGTAAAVEWGHTTVEVGGRSCRCGSRGCLEAYVGAGAILDRYGRSLPGDRRFRQFPRRAPPFGRHESLAGRPRRRTACATPLPLRRSRRVADPASRRLERAGPARPAPHCRGGVRPGSGIVRRHAGACRMSHGSLISRQSLSGLRRAGDQYRSDLRGPGKRHPQQRPHHRICDEILFLTRPGLSPNRSERCPWAR